MSIQSQASESSGSIVRYEPGEKGERPWGRWLVLETGDGFCVKRIEVEPGQRLSLQYHHHRFEDWIIVSGSALVECNTEITPVKTGDRIRIPLLAHHRISNNSSELLIVIEVQHGAILDENDIVRIEDDYVR